MNNFNINLSTNSITYIYDGTFEGLLTIVFDTYIQKCFPSSIIAEENYIPNILDNTKKIVTDFAKSERIFNGIVKNISYDALYHSYYAFLSNDNKKEFYIVQYLVYGFIIGPSINTMLSLDFVSKVHFLRRKMLSESHRLKGLLRFEEVGKNLFYASIHPDNNVIENLGQHFIRRLPSQNFIIHDKNRNILFLYNTKSYKIVSAQNFTIPSITENEKQYQKLWKTFFDTISIKERKNSRLQMQFMPKKYWQDLVEKRFLGRVPKSGF